MSAPIVSAEPRTLNTSVLGTLPVVSFHNDSRNCDDCWVCDSLDTVQRAVAKLATMRHISNVQVHHGCVMFADSNGLKGF